MSTPLIIGTRASELALRQTEQVERSLSGHHSGLPIVRKLIRTAGDRCANLPLAEIPKAAGVGRGVFSAAIQQALLAGEIDCAVHSLKDLPGETDPRLDIAATLPRADIHDVLVLKQGANPENLTIGTGSVRRRVLARAYWGAGVLIKELRGNVPTRLRKLAADAGLSGILLSRAGLTRLGYTEPALTIDGIRLICIDLPQDSFTPAAGQGTIAVQIRRNDTRTRELVSCLDDPITHICSRTERAFLCRLQADCSTPVGAYARVINGSITFRVLHCGPDGILRRVVARGPAESPEDVASLAVGLLQEYQRD